MRIPGLIPSILLLSLPLPVYAFSKILVADSTLVKVGKKTNFTWTGGTPSYSAVVMVNSNTHAASKDGLTAKKWTWLASSDWVQVGDKVQLTICDSNNVCGSSKQITVRGSSEASPSSTNASTSTKKHAATAPSFSTSLKTVVEMVGSGRSTITETVTVSGSASEESSGGRVPDTHFVSTGSSDTSFSSTTQELLSQTTPSAMALPGTFMAAAGTPPSAENMSPTVDLTSTSSLTQPTNDVTLDSSLSSLTISFSSSSTISSSSSSNSVNSVASTTPSSSETILFAGAAVLIIVAALAIFLVWKYLKQKNSTYSSVKDEEDPPDSNTEPESRKDSDTQTDESDGQQETQKKKLKKDTDSDH